MISNALRFFSELIYAGLSLQGLVAAFITILNSTIVNSCLMKIWETDDDDEDMEEWANLKAWQYNEDEAYSR